MLAGVECNRFGNGMISEKYGGSLRNHFGNRMISEKYE